MIVNQQVAQMRRWKAFVGKKGNRTFGSLRRGVLLTARPDPSVRRVLLYKADQVQRDCALRLFRKRASSGTPSSETGIFGIV